MHVTLCMCKVSKARHPSLSPKKWTRGLYWALFWRGQLRSLVVGRPPKKHCARAVYKKPPIVLSRSASKLEFFGKQVVVLHWTTLW